MKEYIDKSAVVAEIEKRLHANGAFDEFGDDAWAEDVGMCNAYKSILSFLDTLEVKEMDNIWHIASETDLPKVGDIVCLIKDGRIISGEYRANKFYGKVCDGYDNSLEKGDKWCYLYGDLLKAEHLKKENEL